MKKTILFFSLLWAVNCNAQGTWSNLGTGIPLHNLGVLALCADTVNNVLYAGGEFDSAGSIKQHALAKWDGTKWDTTVSIYPSVSVYALIMYKGNLIIGFSDGTVGEYDGKSLKYLSSFNQAAYCFYVYNDTLYAGGEFTHSGSTTLNCIAKWNGTKWLPVDNGFSWIDCCPFVSALTEYNGNLIAAGIFDHAGDASVTSIAAYDGNKWTSLDIKLLNFNTVAYNSALEVYNNKLYVDGNFDSVNSIYTTCSVISWDGINSDTIFNNTISSSLLPPATIKMISFDSYLFVGGLYNNQNPYKYDGYTLSTVDSGVIGSIFSMTTWNGSLYIAGELNGAFEERPITPGVARWTPDSTTAIKQGANNNEQVIVTPNPFSLQTTLQFSQPITNSTQLALYDLTGREVENYFISSGAKNFIIKRNNLPAGMYFYKVAGNDVTAITGKVIVE